MNLLFVVVTALPGAAAGIIVTRALLTAHANTSPEAIEAVLSTPGSHELHRRPEDIERALTRELLAGRSSGRRYRRALAELAALEPQPRSLTELLG